MYIEKVHHIYIGIDYKPFSDKSLRIKFSNDAEDIRRILNLSENNCTLYTGSVTKKILEDIIFNLESNKYSGFDIRLVRQPIIYTCFQN